ncbi:MULTISPECIES: HAD-IA family hydrolase [Ralstonia solanacearum species complex]|uniref:Phosphoglycolate phosphatase n=2 Tax=Ralstonia solanacearum TaxID=305 RepID=A0ABF7RAB1_RALSL|nr:HAD-IA family hydrolase [Ralstonia solanacearum]ALF88998.1 Phosphoglycolate phosphatase [Ralstonia solanacearum]ATI28400.1 phosphoglycolate phosphatase, bacterial [Ralstonia solanacearum]ATJ87155.1 phosphoglycolate phosphatase, bacterial [Ralstonia solanacearum]EAP74375.1 Phosphoglycolate phosphatase [Ralstonia solanacearum UW551]KEI32139.1 phosphoglycolate phosphatase [Ralstonia solanacearum]
MTSMLTHFHRQPAQALIVDLDGTMVDTIDDLAISFNTALNRLGLAPVAPALVEQMINKGPEHLVQAALGHAGTDTALHDRCLQLYRKAYGEINGKYARVYPGVVEGLTELKALGIKLACLTNKPGPFARALLKKKRLDSFFSVVFGGDAFPCKKPDPLPVVRTCEALGTTPSRTLVVGDSDNDAQAAKAAGCRIVLVKYGYGGSHSHAHVDGFVDGLHQLRQFCCLPDQGA